MDIGIADCPGVLTSAVYGLIEQFHFANQIGGEMNAEAEFQAQVCNADTWGRTPANTNEALRVIIIPPFLDEAAALAPAPELLQWLQWHHRNGTILCATCAGTFVLGATGLIDGRRVTTHWALAAELRERFPRLEVDVNQLLINDHDVVTAGGLMSWIDLGLELVGQFTHSGIMRQLGKYLIVDTGAREQRFYCSFAPKLDHGDNTIVRVQHQLQRDYVQPIALKDVARQAHLTERTFLRRFAKATGLKPSQYLQQLRVQKACELIETSNLPIERVAGEVGYQDLSAFRRAFFHVTGQTPKAFRRRFVKWATQGPTPACWPAVISIAADFLDELHWQLTVVSQRFSGLAGMTDFSGADAYVDVTKRVLTAGSRQYSVVGLSSSAHTGRTS